MVRLELIPKLLKAGVVTKKYPFEPVEVPEGFRGRPKIDPDLCLGCGACSRVCPPGALSVEDDLERGVRRIKLFVGRCIFCGMCQDVCPADAIRLTKDFELGVFEPSDLYQELELVMVKCPVCGKPHAPARLVAKVTSMLPEEMKDLALLCPSCRMKSSSYYTSYARR